MHDDYHPGNVLWSRGRLTSVVDWTGAGFGDPVSDVCYLRQDVSLVSGLAAGDEVLAAYEAVTGTAVPDRPFWDLLAASRARRAPSALVGQLRRRRSPGHPRRGRGPLSTGSSAGPSPTSAEDPGGPGQAAARARSRTSATSLTRWTVMAVADLVGEVVEVGAVAGREDHLGEPGPVGGQHLLLHAADGQHPAGQRDLAGHADLAAAPAAR